MSKRGRGLAEWTSYILKFLFVMIFPLNIYIVDAIQILFLPTSGMLFPLNSYYTEYLVDFSYSLSTLAPYFINILIGFIIAFPGIYYNYKISRVPLNRSYWKRGVGLCAAICFITLGIVMFLNPFMFSPIGIDDSLMYLSTKLAYYPSLVMAVFVILPLGIRQSVIISVPSDLHYYSMRDIESSSKFNLSREKMLTAIFWLFICFAPYVFQYDMYSWYGGYMYTSFLMDYRLSSNWNMFIDSLSLSFWGQIAAFPFLPFFAILFFPNFLFARDIYRYLRKTITRGRLISMAVFSCFFPLILLLGLSGVLMIIAGPYISLAFLPIPLPILQIVGLFIVRYHRPHIVQTERVWKGDRSVMWWETEPKRMEPSIPKVQSTPEKPNRHREEIIRVPVGYRILSRIRYQRSKTTPQN